MMCTMRVGIHQSEDGDVQRVPKLSHHQPAVHIWHAFSLIHTNAREVTLLCLRGRLNKFHLQVHPK